MSFLCPIIVRASTVDRSSFSDVPIVLNSDLFFMISSSTIDHTAIMRLYQLNNLSKVLAINMLNMGRVQPTEFTICWRIEVEHICRRSVQIEN